MYGGQPQGGISTPSKHPLIFLFTGSSGKEFGYEDNWDNSGIYHYTGEGQLGDMKFAKGNLAIKNHMKNGKELHLFKQLDKGGVEYICQVQYEGYDIRKGLDKNKQEREIIVFALKPIGNIKQAALDDAAKVYKEGDERKVVQTVKERNPILRRDAIVKYGTVCMVCGFDFDKTYGKDLSDGYIEVHHEKMVSETPGVRDVTVDEVKVVCSNCHRIIHRKKKMLDWKILKETIKQNGK